MAWAGVSAMAAMDAATSGSRCSPTSNPAKLSASEWCAPRLVSLPGTK